jgi:peptidoglycan/LPS O-acetylase OafA/YrhL
VVLYHFSLLTNSSDTIWIKNFFSGTFAVNCFFIISGTLVYKSYLNSKTLSLFFKKRFCRIYPAYIFSLILAVLIGALASKNNFIEFFSEFNTFKYLFANLFFLNFLQPTLTDVFSSNPLPEINGSLWTIKNEICLYFCVPFFFWLNKKIPSRITLLFILAISAIWIYYFTRVYDGIYAESISRAFVAQLSLFYAGIYMVDRSRISKTHAFSMFIILFLMYFIKYSFLYYLLLPICLAYLVIFIAFYEVKKINRQLQKLGDLSYGIYLYHFPIIQYCIYLDLYKDYPVIGFILTMLFVLVLSFFSWHFLEKRFLIRRVI